MSGKGFEINAHLNFQLGNLQQQAKRMHRILTDASDVRGGLRFDLSGLTKADKALSKLRNSVNQLNSAANIGKLGNQFQGMTKGMTAAARSTRSFGDSMLSSTKSMAAFTIGAGTLLGTLHAIKAGLSDAIDAQDAFVKVEQVSGRSQKGLDGLKKSVTGLSTAWGVNSNELLDVSRTLLQAGIDAGKTQKALATLAKTSPTLSASMGSLRNQTEAAIAVMGQFGTGVDKLESQFGGINEVSKKFAVEAEDLTQVIRIAGGQWRAAGGDLESLLGVFTAIRSKSREASGTISQGLKGIAARLARKSTRNKLSNLLGIDIESNGQLDKPIVALGKIAAAMRHLPEGSLLGSEVAESVAGIRQLGKFIPLMQNFTTATEAQAVAQRGANSLTRDAITAQGSLAVQIAKVREEWKALARNLVDSEGFKSSVKILLSMASAAAKVADALSPLLPAITAIAGIRAAKFAVGAVPRLLGKAQGGYISQGRGSGIDDVPALLSKNEYVLNPRATAAIGKQNLDAINFGGAKRFARGGSVGGVGYGVAPAEGGLSTVIRELISVIRDEVLVTKQSLDAKRVEKGNLPLSGDAGYSLASTPSRRSRARAAVQRAMALPLARMSFDESAADIAAGGSGDFRTRPATYNLAPALSYHEQALQAEHVPQQRSRFFRRMTREAREARIADLGGSDLLATVRRNALAKQQAAYFEQIGFSPEPARAGIARRSLGGIASYARRSTSFLKNKGFGGQHALLGLGALALNPGTEKFVSGLAGDKVGAAFSSAASGGLVAASVGSFAGPMGSAVLGIGGAAIGTVKALESFKRNLLDDKIEKGFSRIEKAATELGDALEQSGGKITGGVLEKAKALDAERLGNRSAIEKFKGENGPTISESYFPTLGAGFSSLLEGKGFINGMNRKSQELANAADAQAQAKELRQLELTSSGDSALRRGLLSGSKRLGDFGNSFQGQGIQEREASQRTLDKVLNSPVKLDRLKVYAEELKAIQARDAAEERSLLAVRHNTAEIEKFARIATDASSAVTTLNNRFADMQNALKSVDNANALLTGATGSGPASLSNDQHSTALARFGSSGFERAAGLLGTPAAGLLVNANRAHNTLSGVLPALLRSHDIGTDQGFENFRTNIGQALNLQGVHPLAQKEAFDQLEKLHNEGGLGKYATGLHNEDLIGKLTQSEAIKSAHSASVTQLQNAESLQQRHLSVFGQIGALRNAAGESFDRQAELHLDSRRAIASIRRENGLGAGNLSLATLQQPFNLSQQRLTGLGGQAALDPRAIVSQISDLMGRQDTARRQLEANPLDSNAAASVRMFENQIQNSVQALRNLADASKLNAGVQERLAHLDADRAGRSSAFERFAGASPAERRDMEKDARAAFMAKQSGTLDKLSPEMQQRAVRFFGQNRGTRLFGGTDTGDDYLTQLQKSSYGGLFTATAKDRAEREGLQRQQVGNLQWAEAAQAGLTGVQGLIAGRFAANAGVSAPPPIPYRLPADMNDTEATAQAAKPLTPREAKRAAYDARKAARRTAYETRGGGGESKPSPLANALSSFNSAAPGLADSLKNIPHSITFEGKVTHEHIFNGAEALAEMMPAFTKQMEEQAKQTVVATIQRHLPDAGFIS